VQADTDIVARLEEWGRWARTRPHYQRCYSIEGRYRRKSRADDTPTGWGDWLITPPGRVPLPKVNELAALEVERTMRWIPKLHRRVLRFAYVYKMPADIASERLAIPYDLWGTYLCDAQQMVANRIIRLTSKNLGRRSVSTFGVAEFATSNVRPLEPVGSGCNEVREVTA
jgi:hypothetical protein